MKDILEPYVGKQIGSNARKPFHLEPYTFVSVSDSYFTLTGENDTTLVHVPYRNIIRVLQNEHERIHVGRLCSSKNMTSA